MATLAVTNSFSAGTTIVAADMNENFDDIEAFVNTTPGVIQNSLVDAEGDLIIGTAADTVGRLAVGTDTYVLTADSGVSGVGLAWAAPTTGDVTGVAAGTNIDVTSASGPVPSVALAIDAAVDVGVDGTGVDMTFHSSTAGDYMLWDASEEKLVIEGTNAATALDVTDGNVVVGDGSLSVSSTLTVGSDGAGADVTFHSATASDNFLWDASDEKLVITGTNGQNSLEVADGDVSITDKLTVSGGLDAPMTVTTDSTTTRTPALTDAGTYILTTHGTGITVTLPQDSAVAFVVGSSIIFERNGAGTLTFAAGTGATVNSKGGTLTCADRYTTIAATKIAADTWTIFGNIG